MTKNNISQVFSLQRHFQFLLIIVTIVLSVSSCTATKESYYFKTLRKDTTLTGFVTNDLESKIKNGDNLSISVTSLSTSEDIFFNGAAGEKTSNAEGAGFLVHPDGTVLLHRLGNVKVEGLTRKQLAVQLQKDLLPFMREPVVNVNFLNHKVTIIGAVRNPQVLTFPEEQLPLLDVLAKSGDLLEASKKNDIMIIREVNNEKTIKHINLEDHSILTSPWYYVQPNDIVYVLEDYEKTNKAERRARIQTTLSLVASSVSLLIIVIDRIIR